MNFSAVGAIYKKEMKSYFGSPVAYISLAVFLVITGWFFTFILFKENMATIRHFFELTGGQSIILVPLLSIFAPAICMRLVAEERKSGTMELLVTMPVNDLDIIVGKYLSAYTLYLVGLFFTFIYAFTVLVLGNADFGVMFSGYFALILVGAVYIAIGVLGSALSENQIVAFILAFLLGAALSLLALVSALLPPSWFTDAVQYISTTYHFNNMAIGVIDLRDILYFLSIIVLMLYLASIAFAKRRFL